MARENGGGGAFGWTLLGFLAGVAATLGIQTLMSGGPSERPSRVEATSGAVHIITATPASPTKPKKAALASSSASPAPVSPQPAAEVADDAAAAGMTSRTAPASPPPADHAPTTN